MHLHKSPSPSAVCPRLHLCREAERMESMKHAAGEAAGGNLQQWTAMNKRNMQRANKILKSKIMRVNAEKNTRGVGIGEWCL